MPQAGSLKYFLMHLYIQPQRDTRKHTVSRNTSLQEFVKKNFSKKTLFENNFRSAVVMNKEIVERI